MKLIQSDESTEVEVHVAKVAYVIDVIKAREYNGRNLKPEIIEGRLFARGSGDNKAGVVTHYEVVKNLLETLPVNIKIL